MTKQSLEERIAELEEAVVILSDTLMDATQELRSLGQEVYDSDAYRVYNEFAAKIGRSND